MSGHTLVNGMSKPTTGLILIEQAQSMEEAVNTRKPRRVGSDVRFRDGDSTISTAVSRAEARLDRVRTKALNFTQSMR